MMFIDELVTTIRCRINMNATVMHPTPEISTPPNTVGVMMTDVAKIVKFYVKFYVKF